MLYNCNGVDFVTSVEACSNLSNDSTSMEIAFVGCSNSGKSSTINALTNQKKLTKVSKRPGCTQFINIFKIKPNLHIIDFPGYGYCCFRKNKKPKDYWYHQVYQYLSNRRNLKGLILVIDIQRIIKTLDYRIIECACIFSIPVMILLNKRDKVSNYEAKLASQKIRQKIDIMFTEMVRINFFLLLKNVE